MRIFESITSGYKKIAVGIAIVSFLAIMYLAVIPGGVPRRLPVFMTFRAWGLCGAKVKIVEWPLL